MGLTNADLPSRASMTRGLLIDTHLDHRHLRNFCSALIHILNGYGHVTTQAKEALDNRSPVEAVPFTNWELRALTGAAELVWLFWTGSIVNL